MDGKERGNGGEVVITVSSEGTASANMDTKTPKASASKEGEICAPKQSSKPNSPLKESSTNVGGFAKSAQMSCPTPEISRPTHSANKPPKVPAPNENLTRRKSLTRSALSKPKSRFGEQPFDVNMFEDNGLTLRDQMASSSPHRNSFNRESPNNKSASNMRTNSITINPKTPLMASPGRAGNEEDEEDIYRNIELSKNKQRRVKPKLVVEWIALLCISGCSVASLTVDKLEKTVIWGLEFWKWCVLVMVIFSGMLVTNWFMHFVVFLIERNFLLRKKVLYFVHGLKKSVHVFIWIGLVLIAWVLLFKQGVNRSKTANKILNFVTDTLISLLIGSFLWLLKTLFLKVLASNFHVKRFFDRIQESIFHQYVLQTLSGPPVMEMAQSIGRATSAGQLSFRTAKKGKGTKDKKVIDMAKVYRMKQEKTSFWAMKVLVDAVANSRLTTISNTLDESFDDGGGEQADNEITNEMEAMAAACYIFRNVARQGCNYIDEDDLLRFLIKEEVDLIFPLLEGYETGCVEGKALKEWVVKVYKDRKTLAHALTDTKTAVKQLNKLVIGILVIVTIVIWLLLTGVANTKVLLFLSSQLVVAAFMFGNTCKTIFEAIIFVFVMHPFDVGDRCVVDGVPLLVEEMNILNTIFLKLNNEKVYYPNSVLATKPISNYYRSPDMGDTVEFSIDFATPVEKIALLRDKIEKCLEKNPQHWHPNHTVVVKEIENVNKLKMALYCNHTMNFQEFGERNKRRTELMIEIKKIFEELNIKYYLLPQQVHLSHIGVRDSESSNMTNI